MPSTPDLVVIHEHPEWQKSRIKKLYAAKPLTEPQVEEAPAAGSFKIL